MLLLPDFNKIPDEFFDVDVESEKEFKDLIESFSQADTISLTKIHVIALNILCVL
jgi:hypothetical protein